MVKIICLTLTIILNSLHVRSQSLDCNRCACFKNRQALWNVEIDKKGKEYLVRGEKLKFSNKAEEQLIFDLNKSSKVKVKLVKLKSHTVYIKILNSKLFTQSLGDTGADWYLATLIFTLTENSNYNKVYVDFEEGDHGGEPGLKSRKEFNRRYTVCK